VPSHIFLEGDQTGSKVQRSMLDVQHAKFTSASNTMGNLNTHHTISPISSDGRPVSREHLIFLGQPFFLSRRDKLRHRSGGT